MTIGVYEYPKVITSLDNTLSSRTLTSILSVKMSDYVLFLTYSSFRVQSPLTLVSGALDQTPPPLEILLTHL